jgi:hypothetical protein
MPTPPDTVRAKIAAALVALMQTISTTHPTIDYATELGLHVADWGVQWVDAELPACGVCDQIGEVEPSPGKATVEFDDTQTVWSLPFQFRLFAKNVTMLRQCIGDVETAIKSNPRLDVSGTKLAWGIRPRRAGIVVNEQTFEAVAAAVEIEVVYQTGMFDAYQ